MNRFKVASQLMRQFGIGWLLFRLRYALSARTGLQERWFRAYSWSDRPLGYWLKPDIPVKPEAYLNWRKNAGGKFFFDELPVWPDEGKVIEEANHLQEGKWRYFSQETHDTGFPPDWHLNPSTGVRLDSRKHWSRISESISGDIKYVWETSRFGVAYLLVRAHALSHDETYPRMFWDLVEDWALKNPPQTGANWRCGQEASFRVMAWCFALYGFADSPHSTPTRIALLAGMIAAHADRIEKNNGYARSQQNNHAISEGVGLWTVGLLFPEFERSSRWRAMGEHIIVEETLRQVYDDGAYIQHSANYHRLMLHDLIWAVRLGDLNGFPLPGSINKRIALATDFLFQCIEPTSGQTPNYGGNDGALILPLNNCAYGDFRPVLQVARALTRGERFFPSGPWDEDLVWLLGEAALELPLAEMPLSDLEADRGGYYTMRSQVSWALIRCSRYRHRPAHADQLHVDLWWRGLNVACDAGTYLYSGTHPWDNGLATTTVHNTVTVDNQDQMTRIGRFMWVNWARGRAGKRRQSNHLAYWEGQHDGYGRLKQSVIHRRSVLRVGDETWIVLDVLESEGLHDYRLHWLLCDTPFSCDRNRVALHTPVGQYHMEVWCDTVSNLTVRRAEESSVHGWRSTHYGCKEAAISCEVVAQARRCEFWTVFSPQTCTLNMEPDTIQSDGWQIEIARKELMGLIVLSGSMKDELL